MPRVVQRVEQQAQVEAAKRKQKEIAMRRGRSMGWRGRQVVIVPPKWIGPCFLCGETRSGTHLFHEHGFDIRKVRESGP